ncbi:MULTISPECIES: holo-ACP synthase [unclassified Actinomyces]|uniref:holo-ACP synthase AcpS n=1 Tax=unclassified Actinomyces TaxID=2609248 RepID=UPI0020175DE3|nr:MULTISPECIES: holo-ACP synthase [unclassified Actinomyces]MCL3778171.1 holo-ACP synthase [Actinomyces sp. AC-20-1]MCL3790041.1 holo-ACP synthase [Actinomyces sp. 187325]MCL3792730.1 holo-ACP synthase [Actinomyces sp. 186855]MCL3793599.1 holo-ACP synthase [Actinomyces sp. 217892]
MSDPRLPEAPVPPDSCVLGVGTDLVHVPAFAHQLTIPGTVFAERAFTARELREARRRSDATGSLQAEHLAARWAAKESLVKAWSQAANALAERAVPPALAPERLDWRQIEVIGDRWGRPELRLTGEVAAAVEEGLGRGTATAGRWPVSLTHDGDWAAAIVLCTRAAAVPVAGGGGGR